MQNFNMQLLSQDLYSMATEGQLRLRSGLSKTVIQRVRRQRGDPKISTVMKLCRAINQPITKYLY